MKKILWIILSTSLFFHSCSVDTLFSIGVRLPSPHSRYAKAKFNDVTTPFDAIIVPGFPYEPDEVPTILKLRLRWARYLFDKLTKNIIFSGSAVNTPYVEGIAMKTLADSMGLPSNHLFAETQAEHSIENVFYSMRIARDLGFKRIGVATDPFQAWMLEPLIQKYCAGVDLIPIVYAKIKSDHEPIPTINCSDAIVNNFVALRERETRAQRYSGTKGRRVAHEIDAENLRKLFLESEQRQVYTRFDSLTFIILNP